MKKVAHWGALQFVIIPKYHKVDQIKENEMCGSCGTQGRGKKFINGFGGKTRGKESTPSTEVWIEEWDKNRS
jgi:hypothetical protein